MLFHVVIICPVVMMMHVAICICVIMSNICFRFRWILLHVVHHNHVLVKHRLVRLLLLLLASFPSRRVGFSSLCLINFHNADHAVDI